MPEKFAHFLLVARGCQCVCMWKTINRTWTEQKTTGENLLLLTEELFRFFTIYFGRKSRWTQKSCRAGVKQNNAKINNVSSSSGEVFSCSFFWSHSRCWWVENCKTTHSGNFPHFLPWSCVGQDITQRSFALKIAGSSFSPRCWFGVLGELAVALTRKL